MPKATPTTESSLSSILAEALVGTIGLAPSEKAKPSIRKQMAKKFTERLRREAGAEDMWGDTASVLSVDIGDDDVVKVSAQGTPEQMYDAEMLEYGSPNSPARAVMRTYEADFNEQYKVELSRMAL